MDAYCTWRVFVSLLFLALTMCAMPVSTAYQLSFDEAVSRAEGAQGDPAQGAPYARDMTKPLNTAFLNATVRCTQMSPGRSESFNYVLQIEEDGRIGAVYVDSPTDHSACIQRALRRKRLPKPPIAPYFARGSHSIN